MRYPYDEPGVPRTAHRGTPLRGGGIIGGNPSNASTESGHPPSQMATRAPTARSANSGPEPAAVSFVTTEHFTLQGARSSTVAETTGRATMFIRAISGGLVALGLIAKATRVEEELYAFELILPPTLALAA